MDVNARTYIDIENSLDIKKGTQHMNLCSILINGKRSRLAEAMTLEHPITFDLLFMFFYFIIFCLHLYLAEVPRSAVVTGANDPLIFNKLIFISPFSDFILSIINNSNYML